MALLPHFAVHCVTVTYIDDFKILSIFVLQGAPLTILHFIFKFCLRNFQGTAIKICLADVFAIVSPGKLQLPRAVNNSSQLVMSVSPAMAFLL